MIASASSEFAGQRLVIFGCGYVGAEMARQAVARGLRVTALTRNATKAEALRALGVEVVVADLAGAEWHARIAGGAEYVLDCVSSGGGGLEGYRASYFSGMASILAWGATAGAAGTLVYTGSTSVYPQGDGAIVDETAPTDRTNERARVLVDTEEILAARAGVAEPQSAARRWFVLRLAGIYGPGRFPLIEQVRAGEIAGRGEHRLNLIHRDDIVAAVWAAFGAPDKIANEIYNVADDGAAPKGEVAAWLAARLGVAAPRFTGEPLAGRRRVTPDRVIANGKITAALGWRPRYPTFRTGAENLLSH
ncbi:MAG: hypothetical protein RLZZ15_126 [Verrucomicrobiota bacterium]|jgi:nucleoside-diphosphate-sugar epimerase